MAKKTQSPADQWGTPEHEAWRTKTYGPARSLHQMGCKCRECQRIIEWSKGYQTYIAKVDR